MRRIAVLLTFPLVLGAELAAQRATKPPAKRPAATTPAAPASTTVTPEVRCPAPLGTGITSGRAFCDILTGAGPADGMVIDLPPHAGPVTLRFDLHNRQTYSEEQIKANRAFSRYTASVGVMTMDNTLVSRAAIQTEFRGAKDLFDRIGGGAGPGGLKAVAPTGVEHIQIAIPEAEKRVSILGERLTMERLDGTNTYRSAGRPVAIVSNVTIEYRPAPPAKPKTAPKPPAAKR